MEVVIKPANVAILEYLDVVECARAEDIASVLKSPLRSVYTMLWRLVHKGYIIPKLDYSNMRRRIYCINRERKPLINTKDVEIELGV